MNEVIISILTYNKLEYTKKCLETLLERTAPYYRIVVSDNGSTDKTVEWLKSLENKILLIENKQNLGFAKAHNKIIEMYPNHDIILMNNDIEVPYNWLPRLIEKKDFENLGAVSPAIITKNGLDVGAILDDKGRGQSLINDNSEPTWITGSCMYIARSTINSIGLLDNTYNFYFEDVDYCVRMKKQGIAFACNQDVQIIHHNSVSSNPQQKKALMEESKKYFIKKHNWGKK
jgi:O-antigen biosynthesis protein